MNVPTRKTVLLYLAATFVVGAIAGGSMGYGMGRRSMFRPFDREEARVKTCQRFTSELNLNAEQQQKLDPLVRQGLDEMDAAHRQHKERLRGLMRQGRERISEILTPEQRVKFEAIEAEREQRMSSRPKGSGSK
jgi:Spy/CpxP family protein refolding chaperone